MSTPGTPDNREAALRDAQAILWRNLPDHPSTFSSCARACGRGGGRGGGPCLHCAVDDLTKLVGRPQAEAYLGKVILIRRLEEEMRDA